MGGEEAEVESMKRSAERVYRPRIIGPNARTGLLRRCLVPQREKLPGILKARGVVLVRKGERISRPSEVSGQLLRLLGRLVLAHAHMPGTNHHAIQAVGWGGGAFLHAAQETHAALGNRLPVGAELRKSEGAVVGCRSGHKQHPFVDAAPRVRPRAALLRRHDDTDPRLARSRQKL